ncbi:MAG: YabP/YqfC family sporulation protein [Christensenellales bacterium]
MEELCDYQVVFFDNRKVALSGIKGVTYFSDVEIRFKTRARILLLKGKNLYLVETGGTEAYVEGEVLSFEIV